MPRFQLTSRVARTVVAPDGTASVPSIRFSGQSGHGFTRPANNQIGVNIAGTLAYIFTASSIILRGGRSIALEGATGFGDAFLDTDGTNLLLQAPSGSIKNEATVLHTVETGITASTTQTQGQQPLTSTINVVSTVAVANDVVTLPTAVAGLKCHVKNNGANTLQVFPASGDSISGGSVDASTTLAAGASMTLYAEDATNWENFD